MIDPVNDKNDANANQHIFVHHGGNKWSKQKKIEASERVFKRLLRGALSIMNRDQKNTKENDFQG